MTLRRRMNANPRRSAAIIGSRTVEWGGWAGRSHTASIDAAKLATSTR